MAFTLYRTWQTPMAVEQGRWVSLGIGIMGLEFILVHSGIILPALAAAKSVIGRKPIFLVSAMYALFAAGMAFGLKNTMLFWTFSGIMVPRWIGTVIDSDKANEQQVRRSRTSVMLYLGVIFLSVLIRFPRGGLTPEILDSVYPDRGTGVWEQHPQQGLVAGIIYFGAMGIAEMINVLRPRPATNF